MFNDWIVTNTMEFYTSPEAMEPLFPSDQLPKLEILAVKLIEKASLLSGSLNPVTRSAIADFLRPMNSYYSNLIEGHDTHPIDIARALKNEYSNDKHKRDLQSEAIAHIQLLDALSKEFSGDLSNINPASSDFIKSIHRRFYNHLPESFLQVISKEGRVKAVVPGEWRTDEVEVGRHIAPLAETIPLFMQRFESFYDVHHHTNASRIRRIISIAASHHRLAWIHPFLDGNGRVVRLFSDVAFMLEGLDASGLWSVSRGLARSKTAYYEWLANADLPRYNDHDGRGNLSDNMLSRFCEFFLLTAIDQATFMYKTIKVETMLERISDFSDLMTIRKKMRKEAKYILIDLFLKGVITKSDAMRITGLSDKTLKELTDSLAQMGLLVISKDGVQVIYKVNYPIAYSPFLFPGLYPGDKEADLMKGM